MAAFRVGAFYAWRDQPALPTLKSYFGPTIVKWTGRLGPVSDMLVLVDAPDGKIIELDPNDASSDALTEAIRRRPTDMYSIKLYHDVADQGLLLPHRRSETVRIQIQPVDRSVVMSAELQDRLLVFLKDRASSSGRKQLSRLVHIAGPTRTTTLFVPIVCELFVYAFCLVALRFSASSLTSLVRLFHTVRAGRRFRRGHCPKCTYDLAEVPADSYGVRCPECGSQWPALPDYGTLG